MLNRLFGWCGGCRVPSPRRQTACNAICIGAGGRFRERFDVNYQCGWGDLAETNATDRPTLILAIQNEIGGPRISFIHGFFGIFAFGPFFVVAVFAAIRAPAAHDDLARDRRGFLLGTAIFGGRKVIFGRDENVDRLSGFVLRG